MPAAAHTSASTVLHFEGGNALSAFRAQALLLQLQAVSPRTTSTSWPAC